MIQCPSCAKDIADDSAHCGFCGAKIETGAGKKTMMGFAALSGDALKAAAEEARQARQAADVARSERRPSGLPERPKKIEREESKPRLPQLPRSTPQASLPSAPAPAPAPAPQRLEISPTEDADSDARTAVMEAVGASPTTVEEGAVEVADTDPMAFGGGDDPKTVPVAAVAPQTKPEVTALPGSGPSSFGAGPIDDGPSEFGSGKIDFAQNTLPEKKKKNPALLVVGAIAIMMLMCCFAWIAYGIILPIFMAL